jgi:hypothetical protein
VLFAITGFVLLESGTAAALVASLDGIGLPGPAFLWRCLGAAIPPLIGAAVCLELGIAGRDAESPPGFIPWLVLAPTVLAALAGGCYWVWVLLGGAAGPWPRTAGFGEVGLTARLTWFALPELGPWYKWLIAYVWLAVAFGAILALIWFAGANIRPAKVLPTLLLGPVLVAVAAGVLAAGISQIDAPPAVDGLAHVSDSPQRNQAEGIKAARRALCES